MNSHTFKILEFDHVKELIAQFTMSEAGKDNIVNLAPSTNVKQIRAWLDEVTEAVNILEKSASVPISSLNGMELIISQLDKGLTLKPAHFKELAEFLISCKRLKQYMKDKEFLAPRVTSYVYGIEDLSRLLEEIERCIRNGRVDDYASKELVKIRKQMSIQEDRLKDKLNQIIKSSKYKSYLQEFIVSERNGHYVIPIKKEYKGKIKGVVLDTSASGATLYIEPEEAAFLREQISILKANEETEVDRILAALTVLVDEHLHEIRLAMETMVHYDVLFAKAKYSRLIEGRSVEVNETFNIRLKGARHPLLEKQAVPLTIELGERYNALIITGPNTGGKTVTIKTVGLLTIMVQSGLHIPVDEGSEISIFKKVLLDIGDGQSIEQNLSTFSSHIKNIIELLKEANEYSLVLLDELGSGTDPGEGMGLATAILKQFHQKGATILATTHYSEIKDFADKTDGFMNGSMEFDIHTLQPTYRLNIGTGGESQAFAIALRLGMHPTIISDAYQITYKEEKVYEMECDNSFEKREMDKQIALNRYIKTNKQKKPTSNQPVVMFQQGDNVHILATGEYGIIYKGPDSFGNYLVQVKNEKKTFNYKRLKLYIAANELYPEDYDFNIIFESKENRKKAHLMERKHVDGLTIEVNDKQED
ncbi:endonuclease MutS2 [Heyndrickxia oleronia]|uniref:DNA mismatch repair protein n=1 Tax=Heyndrickxia oleronia TaxID=38875 RepID=A0A8E2I9N7_9BACI|nr:DNA mismatch repair protein [Heyndrickxia oleronia]MEC1374321.1 endonuclease MutS2 [Heyndrickxia oleronia]OOP66860.1 DNA mismatch repair protein [Heyndrickxia oleronia]QQZ07094.1 endonuclease MutS2 [Heyndrickxia oleronia]